MDFSPAERLVFTHLFVQGVPSCGTLAILCKLGRVCDGKDSRTYVVRALLAAISLSGLRKNFF